MKKVALVLGTRPEAIKLAPVYLRFKEVHPSITPLLWLTGQHNQMLQQAMSAFGIEADTNFHIMTPGQSLTTVSTRVLEALEGQFEAERPDMVVVQGDTTTAFSAALAAFYAKIPVAHVEAGLRTQTKDSPYPEEMNRQLVGRLADLHFAPTSVSCKNLEREGVGSETIYVTGNTVVDALVRVLAKVRANKPGMPDGFPRIAEQDTMCLITGHRRENFGHAFEELCRAIADVAVRRPEALFVYPVHLNPNVQKPVYSILGGIPNVHLLPPLSYEQFVWAMDRATVLLSDSGGVQEEAAHLGKPVLVMRESTERPEGIAAGTSILVGTDKTKIREELLRALDRRASSGEYLADENSPFGDGRASERICAEIERYLYARTPIRSAPANQGDFVSDKKIAVC